MRTDSESELKPGLRQSADNAAGTALAVRSLYKSFGGIHAVAGVEFSACIGEIVGIIGPNGSGKTTLLNVLAGYYRADAGAIVLFGEDIVGLPANEVAQRGLLRTWQDPRVVEGMTVRQNTSLGLLARRGAKAASAAEKVDALLKEFHLDDCAHMIAGTLSYGQQKIVSIARTFAAEPTFLLLDEPLAGLSKTEVSFVFDIIRKFRSTGTVLIVDHAFGSLSRLCDRVIVLNSGRKLTEGSFSQVAEDPEVKEVYFGHR